MAPAVAACRTLCCCCSTVALEMHQGALLWPVPWRLYLLAERNAATASGCTHAVRCHSALCDLSSGPCLQNAVALLHCCGLVHTDLKMDNILMAQPAGQGRVGLKLADLGSCISVTGTDTTRVSFEMQTLPYRAPEVMALLGGG